MFDEICSIYRDAKDALGRYVDMETGECITQMSIREFCLTDRWKPYVEKLRAMRQQYGSKAKKMPEYIDTKKMLPGATLSGLFATYEDDSLTHPGQRVMVSRRETHLYRHTGWLAIDIDLQDNQGIADFENIRRVLAFRPEVALLMRSCSGTGLFGLVRLAYPEHHKEQFKALLQEYAALGIMLDGSCGNIGRVRFASWDDPEHIYINEKATPYTRLPDNVPTPMPVMNYSNTFFSGSHPTGAGHGGNYPHGGYSGGYRHDTPEIIYRKALRLVEKIEARGIDICAGKDATSGYLGWVKCGMSLYHVDRSAGYDLWRRVSRFRPADSTCGHNEMDFRKRWNQFANYNKISEATFFDYCKRSGIFLTREDWKEIYQNT